jgi:hypothetical protein
VFQKLVRKNGTQVYIDDVDRRRKVVAFYMKKYQIIDTSVENYWKFGGGCILIGKAM